MAFVHRKQHPTIVVLTTNSKLLKLTIFKLITENFNNFKSCFNGKKLNFIHGKFHHKTFIGNLKENNSVFIVIACFSVYIFMRNKENLLLISFGFSLECFCEQENF